jgi:hypothetical protein
MIMSEVFTQSDTRLATRLVLLALADAANDSHRMCWESVDTIAAKARVSRRQVFTALATLEERRVVEHVPDAEKPAEAERYKSVVRRVLPVSEWLPEPSKGAESAPLSEGAESAQVSKFSPNPNNQLEVRDIEETTFLPPRRSARSNPGEAEEIPVRPGARGWNAVAAPKRGGRKKTRKQQAEEAALAEKELDPAYVVAQTLGEEDPGSSPAGRLPASDDDLAPPVRRPREKRSKRPSEELAEFFGKRAEEVGHPVPGATNLSALYGNFGRWMAQGLERETIRQMIITYWSSSWNRSENHPAWKDFLGARGLLTERLGKVDNTMEKHRHDESFWD